MDLINLPPLLLLILVAILFIVAWKIIKFAVKVLIVFLFIILIMVTIFIFPKLLGILPRFLS